MSRVKEAFEVWQEQAQEQEQRELATIYDDKRWDEIMAALRERHLVAVPEDMLNAKKAA